MRFCYPLMWGGICLTCLVLVLNLLGLTTNGHEGADGSDIKTSPNWIVMMTTEL